jgi:hypothetical protein
LVVNDRYPLSPTQRLEGFKVSYELYKEQKVFDSISSETSISLIPAAVSGQDLHGRLSRAAALRKFVLGEKDPYYLVKIHDCVEELGIVRLDSDSKAHLCALLVGLQKGQAGPITIHEDGVGNPTPDSRIVDDALNGARLHSDPEKMWRHMSRNEATTNLALFTWLAQAEAVCDLAYEMACKTLASPDLA